MSTTHTIRAEDQLEASGVALLTLVATITFRWQPATGDGWNEPRQSAYAERVSVRQHTHLPISDADLNEWADAWLEGDHGHAECAELVREVAF